MTATEYNQQGNQLWGGRFAGSSAAIMQRINASIDVDKALYQQDINASIVHAQMLARQGIISATDAKAITTGLEQIRGEIAAGQMVFDPALEDIHMHVETRLKAIIGEAAGRLHTGRSRNDQVATDFRLFLRESITQLLVQVRDVQRALLDKAEQYAAAIMPGFTHLQIAQPVTFGHHLLAYGEMLARDYGRLQDCQKRLNECPLGAAALAGTSYPIDRQYTASQLGFEHPCHNSMDAVSARDFAAEFLATASICATHLSRLAEEICFWLSPTVGFISLSDAYTTGSSIMPQKRNPDAAELVRGKVGGMLGAFVGLITMLKGLPLTYSKDMQEDKAPVLQVIDNLSLCLAATAGMVADLTANTERMADAAALGYSTATDLADWLVQELNMPFRQAHHVTGALVKLAEEKGCTLDALDLTLMQGVEPRLHDGVYAVLSPAQSVQRRTSYGGTAPALVRDAVQTARVRYLC